LSDRDLRNMENVVHALELLRKAELEVLLNVSYLSHLTKSALKAALISAMKQGYIKRKFVSYKSPLWIIATDFSCRKCNKSFPEVKTGGRGGMCTSCCPNNTGSPKHKESLLDYDLDLQTDDFGLRTNYIMNKQYISKPIVKNARI
jgi:Zn finger protein HypA/HybF involved in hydrogenase expression